MKPLLMKQIKYILVPVCDNWIRDIFQTVHSYIKAKLVKVSRILSYFLLKRQLLKDAFLVQLDFQEIL